MARHSLRCERLLERVAAQLALARERRTALSAFVASVERLRGEERFDSVEALVEQMHRDIEDARRICASFAGTGQ